jgi:hypothetical protein
VGTAGATPIKPLDATVVDLSELPRGTIDVQLSGLEQGPPSRVPWTEFEGNPEQGRERFLHVGARSMPLRRDGYLREIAVWPTGVIWYQDFGLRFLGWDGAMRKVRGVPAWFGLVGMGPTKLYFVKKGALASLSAPDLVPRTEMMIADLVQEEPQGAKLRASMIGLLGPEEPLIRVTYQQDSQRTTGLYSLQRGLLPLDTDWSYYPWPTSDVLLAQDRTGRRWAAYDRELRPLWTRTFRIGDRRPFMEAIHTPTGNKIVFTFGRSGQQVIVVDADTGRVGKWIRVPSFDITFESDSAFVFPAYDGPPNPFFDPSDSFPEPSELTWPNLLVRCSLKGRCEQAARVPAPERSVHTGLSYLF